METGYPTEGWFHDEAKQVDYINTAFSAIKSRAQSTYIAFVTWYMLWDESPKACEVGYCEWGVLREDFSRKPGWYALRDWFVYELRW